MNEKDVDSMGRIKVQGLDHQLVTLYNDVKNRLIGCMAVRRAREPLETIKDKVRDVVTKALSDSIDIEELKEEVCNCLSAIYYKYETKDQKRAFREVMQDISKKINEGKWETIYKKLYREEKREKIF